MERRGWVLLLVLVCALLVGATAEDKRLDDAVDPEAKDAASRLNSAWDQRVDDAADDVDVPERVAPLHTPRLSRSREESLSKSDPNVIPQTKGVPAKSTKSQAKQREMEKMKRIATMETATRAGSASASTTSVDDPPATRPSSSAKDTTTQAKVTLDEQVAQQQDNTSNNNKEEPADSKALADKEAALEQFEEARRQSAQQETLDVSVIVPVTERHNALLLTNCLRSLYANMPYPVPSENNEQSEVIHPSWEVILVHVKEGNSLVDFVARERIFSAVRQALSIYSPTTVFTSATSNSSVPNSILFGERKDLAHEAMAAFHMTMTDRATLRMLTGTVRNVSAAYNAAAANAKGKHLLFWMQNMEMPPQTSAHVGNPFQFMLSMFDRKLTFEEGYSGSDAPDYIKSYVGAVGIKVVYGGSGETNTAPPVKDTMHDMSKEAKHRRGIHEYDEEDDHESHRKKEGGGTVYHAGIDFMHARYPHPHDSSRWWNGDDHDKKENVVMPYHRYQGHNEYDERVNNEVWNEEDDVALLLAKEDAAKTEKANKAAETPELSASSTTVSTSIAASVVTSPLTSPSVSPSTEPEIPANTSWINLKRQDYLNGTRFEYHRLRYLQTKVLAVSKAGMMVPRQLFIELKGFAETKYASQYMDIDFCLRIHQIDLALLPGISKSDTSGGRPLETWYVPYPHALYHDTASTLVGVKYAPALDEGSTDAQHFADEWGKSPFLKDYVTSRYSLLNTSLIWNMECGTGQVLGFTSEAINIVLGLHKRIPLYIESQDFDACETQLGDMGMPTSTLVILRHLRGKNVRSSEWLNTDIFLVLHRDPGRYDSFRRSARDVNIDYCIGRSMYETNKIPSDWSQNIKTLVDEVWVPSHFNIETFAQNGVSRKQLYQIPEPIDVYNFDPRHMPGLMSLDADKGFIFLTAGKWEKRKGWDLLLRAYFGSFSASDDVSLYVLSRLEDADRETYAADVKTICYEVDKQIEELPRVVFISEKAPFSRLPHLYKSADAFVLPTHGEGWGLPLMEAMAMELPTIATNWSGNTQFMREHNSFLVEVEEMVEANKEGHLWAKPSVQSLGTTMKWIYNNQEEAKAKARQARADVVAAYTQDKVGTAILSQLVDIRIHRLAAAKKKNSITASDSYSSSSWSSSWSSGGGWSGSSSSSSSSWSGSTSSGSSGASSYQQIELKTGWTRMKIVEDS